MLKRRIFCLLLFGINILSNLNGISSESCPSRLSIIPCECIEKLNRQIICEKSLYTGHMLKQIFQEASRDLQLTKPIKFGQFILQNSLIEDLTDDTFDKFAFTEIRIRNNEYLKTIDIQAFKSSYYVSDKLLIESNQNLASVPFAEIQIFELLSKFSNLSFIWLNDCGLKSIPVDAFKGNHFLRLEIVSLANNKIHQIESRAFYALTNLRHLNLKGNQIDYLKSDSLKMQIIEYDYNMSIDLSENRLNSQSFAHDSLASIKRSLQLDLSHNHLTYLNESIFLPLFTRSIDVKLWGNPITCSNCSLKWLTNEQTCASTSKRYVNQKLIHFTCLDDPFKKQLTERDYSNCPSSEIQNLEKYFSCSNNYFNNENSNSSANFSGVKFQTLILLILSPFPFSLYIITNF